MELAELLSEDVMKAVKAAVDDFEDNFDSDTTKVREALSETFSELGEQLASAESLSDIVQLAEDMDARTTLLLSATLSTIGEQRAKAANALKDLLENIALIIVKKVITVL